MKKKPDRILISSLLITILCVAALALSATLPGGGWWFGAQVQNASSGNAVVTYTVYDYATPNPQTRVDNISSGASRTYLPTDFSLPGNFQGSSIASSNQDIRAIVNLTNRYTGSLGDIDSPSPAAGQYQGMGSVDTKLTFPLVKNDYVKKSTTIVVQNAGTGPAAATAAFKFQGDVNTYNYTTPVLNPGQMAIFGPIDARRGTYPNYYHPLTGAVGSLTVTSSQLLAGIALEHFTGEDHATVLQATRGFIGSDADSMLYAPINKTFVTNAMDITPHSAIVLQDMRLMESNPHPPTWWHHWNGASMNPTVLGCAEGTYNGCGANGVFSLILNSTDNNYPIVAVANESTYPNTAPLINQDKSNYEAFSLTSVP
jgi:hypothetical protein